ncbi:MAG: NUDIX hydrolase, partial [Prevotellaceae bacterium]|nr:NUDIX hydrolase [Prevotellaceae bacterium]
MNLPLANNHISVDCVVFGFDGSDLNALLIQRKGEHNGYQYEDMKLPGRLIYQDEDLDAAAARTLKELAGFRNVRLMQFKTYGSMNRTRDMRDVLWLEKEQDARVDRIVTVAYVAFVKIERALARIDHRTKAVWVKMDQVGS